MIWLSTVSLPAGGLLARRFKIILVALATIVVVVVAIVWLTILMATASRGIKMGYFLGIYDPVWLGCASGARLG